MSQDYKYIQDTYKVPAEYGRIVLMEGKRCGIIVEAFGQYVGILFDDKKPGNIETCHPTWELEYQGIGIPRKMTRGQQQYRDYLEDDGPYSFIEYCTRQSHIQKHLY